jgi:hypothetical protein
MIIETLKALFARDLAKLRTEISMYSTEANLWKVDKMIANSAGNLCLHLVGNLNTYIGKELGGTGYVRDRDAEFALKNVPKSELLDKIDNTLRIVDLSLGKLSSSDLQKQYPVLVLKEATTIEYFLIHLATHLTYHLGQINYHRRLLDV